jgi:diacylglycerol kinase
MSFTHAFAGIAYALRTQRNMRIHVVVAALVLAAALATHLPARSVVAIVIAIAMVLAAELVNTAIEAVVDLTVAAPHPLAKIAKDTAAGAVLIVAGAAVVIGALTFYEGLSGGGSRVGWAAPAPGGPRPRGDVGPHAEGFWPIWPGAEALERRLARAGAVHVV